MPEFEEKRKVKIEWLDNDIWNGKTGFIVYEDPEDSSETSTVTVRITDFPTEDGFQEVDQNFEKRFVKPYEEAEKDIEFSEEEIQEEPVEEIPSEEEEKVFKEETVQEESLNEELAEDYFIRIERQGNTMWIVKVHDAHSYEEAECKALKAIHIDDDIDEISREQAESEIEDGEVILIDETGTEIDLDESLKESEEPEAECCICHKHFKGYGNNPYPVAEDGRCCDECNIKVVIPARINQLGKGVPSDIDFDDEEFEDCEDCREYSEIPDDLD